MDVTNVEHGCVVKRDPTLPAAHARCVWCQVQVQVQVLKQVQARPRFGPGQHRTWMSPRAMTLAAWSQT